MLAVVLKWRMCGFSLLELVFIMFYVTSYMYVLCLQMNAEPAYDIIITIITYIYNALNDALSASRIHNKLKTILSKYIHIQNRQS